jgi:hypothetical protein
MTEILYSSMTEILYSAQSGITKNAYRNGDELLLVQNCSLPNICIACGNGTYGNAERKEMPKISPWFWVLPTGLDLLALFMLSDKFVFDFPFCPNCPPSALRLKPVRLDWELVVLRGASERVLELLPPPPPDVAAERKLSWLQRKIR